MLNRRGRTPEGNQSPVRTNSTAGSPAHSDEFRLCDRMYAAKASGMDVFTHREGSCEGHGINPPEHGRHGGDNDERPRTQEQKLQAVP